MLGQNELAPIFRSGITKEQILELIKYSKRDILIKKFTHDSARFKDIVSFKEWSDGKKVYTLTDESKKLLGIIWFGKKDNPELGIKGFSFAIRIYKIARGRGLAKKFMTYAFNSFRKTSNYKNSIYKNIWLSTMFDNSRAIGLYKSFGFIEKKSSKGYVTMILSN